MSTTQHDTKWEDEAACRTAPRFENGDPFFPTSRHAPRPGWCDICTVKDECLGDAITVRSLPGIADPGLEWRGGRLLSGAGQSLRVVK